MMPRDLANTIQTFLQDDAFQMLAERMYYILTGPRARGISIGHFDEFTTRSILRWRVNMYVRKTDTHEVSALVISGHYGSGTFRPMNPPPLNSPPP